MKFSSPQNRRVLLGTILWLILVSQVMIYPSVPDLVVELGAPAGIDGGMWFLVAEYGGLILFAILWGILSDAAGRRMPYIVSGALGASAVYLLIPHLPTLGVGFGGVLLVRFLGGGFVAGAVSLTVTMLMDLEEDQGTNMGVAGTAIGLGAAAGSTAGGRLAEASVTLPLTVSGSILATIGLLALILDEDVRRRNRQFRFLVDKLLQNPIVLVPAGFGLIDRLTAGFFSLVGVYYFQEVFDLGTFETGVVLSLFFLPFALLQVPMGVLSDRIGRFLPVVPGSIAYGFTIAGVGIAPTYQAASILMVLVGVCGALVAPATMALVADVTDRAEYAAAMGVFNSFGSVGFLLGFLLGGISVRIVGYLGAFVFVGGLEVLIALTLFPFVLRGTEPTDGAE